MAGGPGGELEWLDLSHDCREDLTRGMRVMQRYNAPTVRSHESASQLALVPERLLRVFLEIALDELGELIIVELVLKV